MRCSPGLGASSETAAKPRSCWAPLASLAGGPGSGDGMNGLRNLFAGFGDLAEDCCRCFCCCFAVGPALILFGIFVLVRTWFVVAARHRAEA